MRRSHLRIGIVILAIAFLCILTVTIHAPTIYAAENTSSTHSHDNLQLKKLLNQETTSAISPLMSDILDSTGTVTLSLKLKDFDAAARDLKVYSERMDRLSNLIIQLDLSESELDTWMKQNSENLIELSALYNETERFSQLEHLEVTYQNANQSHQVYTVAYEGEAIRTKITELSRKYMGRQELLARANGKFDLNTSIYRASAADIVQISQSVDGRQKEREATLGAIPSVQGYALSLSIPTPSGRYGDQLTFIGTLSSSSRAVQAITLYIDSIPLETGETDDTGVYYHSLQVDRMSAGMHLAYAQVGETYSAIVPFTILARDTALTLNVASNGSTGLTCSGILMSEQIPVSGAPVDISNDGRIIQSIHTDSSGSYQTGIVLSEGTHRLKAAFASQEYPLNASESDPITITITRTGGEATDRFPIFTILLYGGSIGVCAMGARWYLSRQKVRAKLVGGEPMERGPDILPVPANLPSITEEVIVVASQETPVVKDVKDLTQRFLVLLDQGQTADGAYLLYRWIRERVARREGLSGAPTLTPRELVHAVQVLPCADGLAAFVRLYEPIRYGCRIPDLQERSTFLEFFRTIAGIEEGDGH